MSNAVRETHWRWDWVHSFPCTEAGMQLQVWHSTVQSKREQVLPLSVAGRMAYPPRPGGPSSLKSILHLRHCHPGSSRQLIHRPRDLATTGNFCPTDCSEASPVFSTCLLIAIQMLNLSGISLSSQLTEFTTDSVRYTAITHLLQGLSLDLHYEEKVQVVNPWSWCLAWAVLLMQGALGLG